MAIPGVTLGAARALLVAGGLLLVSGAGLARGVATREIQSVSVRDDTTFAGMVARLSEPGSRLVEFDCCSRWPRACRAAIWEALVSVCLD